MATTDWNDTKSMLFEIEQIFLRDDDVKDINDIQKMLVEIQNERNGHLTDFRELIRQYSEKVTIKEQEILAPPMELHYQNIDKINSEKENLISKMNHTSQKIDQEQEAISKLAENSIQIQQNTNLGMEDPHLESRTSYALSLYGKISNISWDYHGTPGHLVGCYANEMTKEMYNFDFDLNEMSSFDLTNALWDMIGESMPEIAE